MSYIFEISKESFHGIPAQKIQPFYENNNFCQIKVNNFKKPFNCFLSHDGLFVYMYSIKNVFRTKVFCTVNGNVFNFPIEKDKEDKEDKEELCFYQWETLQFSY